MYYNNNRSVPLPNNNYYYTMSTTTDSIHPYLSQQQQPSNIQYNKQYSPSSTSSKSSSNNINSSNQAPTSTTYSSLATYSTIDINTIKENNIWSIDNLLTIEEAEQLIDIFQDLSPRNFNNNFNNNYNNSYKNYNNQQQSNDHLQEIEYTNEEFSDFIFDQLKNVLPKDQTFLFGEKIGKKFELSGIHETFTIFEILPGEYLKKRKSEEKCRIIEEEEFDEMNNNFKIEQFNEKNFLTCLICLKGLVLGDNYQLRNNSPRMMMTDNSPRMINYFGVSFYDIAKEKPEIFISLDHVGKSCLFRNEGQLFEAIENIGQENIYLLELKIMYKSKLNNNNLRKEMIIDYHSNMDVSTTMIDNNQNNKKEEITVKKKEKKNENVLSSRVFYWAFGTSLAVLTSVLLQSKFKIFKSPKFTMYDFIPKALHK
ncbi:hypothetical protein ABK040_000653 [Willaertia magna]